MAMAADKRKARTAPMESLALPKSSLLAMLPKRDRDVSMAETVIVRPAARPQGVRNVFKQPLAVDAAWAPRAA